ncbi:hypothetical protein Bca101_022244 [Brassica carinata]
MTVPPLFLLLLTLLSLPSLLIHAAISDAYPTIPGTAPIDGGFSDDLKPIRREVYGEGKIFDISHRYTPEMPAWDSKEGIGRFLWLAKSMKNGSLANNSEMKMPTHTGTHVDSPGHVYDEYYDAGFDVDSLDLQVLNAEVMKSLNIPRGVRRVLFRTLNTDRRLMFKKEFDTSYVGFMKDGAQWLVDNTDIKLHHNLKFLTYKLIYQRRKMEGALQSVKALLTAMASQFYNMIKYEIDSTNAMINHVMESVREAMERMDQKLAEEVSRIREERSESFQTSHQSVEVVMPCRRENNDDEEEESEFHDAMGSSKRIQVDEDEFLDSNTEFEDMAKDEAAGEDGAVTRVADVMVGGDENKF